MKRKEYQTPATKVVMIQLCSILAASNPKGKGENFTWG